MRITITNSVKNFKYWIDGIMYYVINDTLSFHGCDWWNFNSKIINGGRFLYNNDEKVIIISIVVNERWKEKLNFLIEELIFIDFELNSTSSSSLISLTFDNEKHGCND